jgi:hypothetical protein
MIASVPGGEGADDAWSTQRSWRCPRGCLARERSSDLGHAATRAGGAASRRPAGDAEEIASGAHGRVPPSDVSSIYRNLEMLEQEGLVYHLHPGHGPRHYRLAGCDTPCYLV